MIFPQINISLEKYIIVNEILWSLDIIRKLMFRRLPGMDEYTSAVKYIKSTLILDLIAILPQLFSFTNPVYASFRNFRLY